MYNFEISYKQIKIDHDSRLRKGLYSKINSTKTFQQDLGQPTF